MGLQEGDLVTKLLLLVVDLCVGRQLECWGWREEGWAGDVNFRYRAWRLDLISQWVVVDGEESQ